MQERRSLSYTAAVPLVPVDLACPPLRLARVGALGLSYTRTATSLSLSLCHALYEDHSKCEVLMKCSTCADSSPLCALEVQRLPLCSTPPEFPVGLHIRKGLPRLRIPVSTSPASLFCAKAHTHRDHNIPIMMRLIGHLLALLEPLCTYLCMQVKTLQSGLYCIPIFSWSTERALNYLYLAGRPVMTHRGLAAGGGAFCGCISLGGSMFAISYSICDHSR